MHGGGIWPMLCCTISLIVGIFLSACTPARATAPRVRRCRERQIKQHPLATPLTLGFHHSLVSSLHPDSLYPKRTAYLILCSNLFLLRSLHAPSLCWLASVYLPVSRRVRSSRRRPHCWGEKTLSGSRPSTTSRRRSPTNASPSLT